VTHRLNARSPFFGLYFFLRKFAGNLLCATRCRASLGISLYAGESRRRRGWRGSRHKPLSTYDDCKDVLYALQTVPHPDNYANSTAIACCFVV
jgi:hypothetical protein